jgi:hypothetical protein
MPTKSPGSPSERAEALAHLLRIRRELNRFDLRHLNQILRAASVEAGLSAYPPPIDIELFPYLTEPPEVLARPVESLGLRSTLNGLLGSHGVFNLGDLLLWSRSELNGVERLGIQKLTEITVALHDNGLRLSPHDQGIDAPAGDRWVVIDRQFSPLRRVLLSQVPNLVVVWLELYYDSDNPVLSILLEQHRIERVWQLTDLTEAQLLDLSWSRINKFRLSRRLPSLDDPAQQAVSRIRAMLHHHGLDLAA